VKRSSAIIFIVALFSACASGQFSGDAADADAKAFKANPEAARVYIVRPSGFVGSGRVGQITVDGTVVGALGPNQFVVVNVTPGSHVFALLSENQQHTNKLDAHAGDIYFLETQWVEGTLIRLNDADGRARVAAARRVEALTP
jgi:hypothetical protein